MFEILHFRPQILTPYFIPFCSIFAHFVPHCCSLSAPFLLTLATYIIYDGDEQPSVERLGILDYRYGHEGLHGATPGDTDVLTSPKTGGKLEGF